MIVPSEIIEDDIVKVLVNEDGMEDQMYGVVAMNTGNTLGLRYLNPTELFYKSACVYELETTTFSPAPFESVMEHYPSGTTFMDLEMKSLGNNMFAYYSEIDIEDSDSDKAWSEWKPSSIGARSFKDTIDAIETRVRRLSE